KELYKRTVRLVGGSYDWQNQKQLSFYEKNLSFIKVLFDNIIPPLNFVFNAFKDNRLENINAKIKVCWVMFCVRYISAWEIIRLKLGGVSAR
ncbi:MAG TPA: glycosyl transferase family 2, partial [Cyanobacteria bacterium UBA11371]|nr:glycosyl transferase family 2 [Cyanobacteria bacterium UBA11371]